MNDGASPEIWLLESPHVAVDLVARGLGWSMLNHAVVAEKLATGELIHLQLAFEKADVLQGIDVVWSQSRHLGAAGSWMLERLQGLDITIIED